MESEKKRGRKPMTEEEKVLAKIEKQQKAELKAKQIADGTYEIGLIQQLKELNKEIKKGVPKLSVKDIEKVKELLQFNYGLIDKTIEENKEKEKELIKKSLEKELEDIKSKQKELEDKLKGLK